MSVAAPVGTPPVPGMPVPMAPVPQMGDQAMQWTPGPEGVPSMPVSRVTRTRVKLPRPKYKGGSVTWDNVPSKDAAFGWGEMAVTSLTRGASLAPDPEVDMKMWYNSYVYVPEQRSHLENQFLERFVPDPEREGEWLDAVKAQRMVEHFYNVQREHQQHEHEKELVRGGEAMFGNSTTLGGDPSLRGHWADAYSGEQLFVAPSSFVTEKEAREKYGALRSEWKDAVDTATSGFDFANLRVPWPFGKPIRNKKVSSNLYEWYDRRNMYITSDRTYQTMELPSVYVDKENYQKWRTGGGESGLDYAADVLNKVQAVDDAHYRL